MLTRCATRYGPGSPRTGTRTVRWWSGGTLLADSGWGCPSWPTDWLGQAACTPGDATQVAEAFSEVGAVGPAAGTEHDPGRAHAVGPRLRAAPTAVPAPHPHRRAHVVPAVQRAGQRLGPRRAHHPGRPRRRRVDRQRAEGVEHRRPPRRTTACCSPAPTGTSPSTRASATSCCRHEAARHRGAPAETDERPRRRSTRCS